MTERWKLALQITFWLALAVVASLVVLNRGDSPGKPTEERAAASK